MVREKIIESLYQDFVSVANQIFSSQMNFLMEFRPGWSELRNSTALRHNFSTVSFNYSLAKTLNNENLLFEALSFRMIRTIHLFSLDIYKFFPLILNRALSILTQAPLLINFISLPPRPQIINKKKIGVILLAYHLIS